MIPEERLRIAAEESHELYINTLLSRGDYEAPHKFSPEFEAKIEKIKRNIGKKSPRRVLQKVASFILAVLVCASAWLAVDAEARAKVFGWVKGVYDGLFVYHFESDKESRNTSEKKGYRLTWIPEGYTEWYADLEAETAVIVYTNEAGEMLKFNYASVSDDIHWMIDYSQMDKYTASVHGCNADILISQTAEDSNSILWTLPDNTAFYIGAFLDAEDLVKIAESVVIVEEK